MANAPVPGMNYPTQKGMLAGNPRDSAMQAGENMNAKQASLGKIGGRKRYKRGGTGNKGGSINVPQYTMLYQPQGGNGTNPNAQIQQNAGISTQGAANSVYDQQAMSGGKSRKRIYKKGGSMMWNPNWNWGCYSGGKRRTRKSRKSRKHRRR
jgi:hypothetical protein